MNKPEFRARVVVPPTAEPISLEDARQHVRITPYLEDGTAHPDDLLLMALVGAAREFCEEFTGMSLALKTYEAAADSFPPNGVPLELPHPPFVALESVVFGSGSGDVFGASDVDVDLWSNPQRLFVPGDWPAVEKAPGAVRVRYQAGYRLTDAPSSDTTPELPKLTRAALLLVVGHLYENREASVERALQELPLGVTSLLRPLRVRKGMA